MTFNFWSPISQLLRAEIRDTWQHFQFYAVVRTQPRGSMNTRQTLQVTFQNVTKLLSFVEWIQF